MLQEQFADDYDVIKGQLLDLAQNFNEETDQKDVQAMLGVILENVNLSQLGRDAFYKGDTVVLNCLWRINSDKIIIFLKDLLRQNENLLKQNEKLKNGTDDSLKQNLLKLRVRYVQEEKAKIKLTQENEKLTQENKELKAKIAKLEKQLTEENERDNTNAYNNSPTIKV